MVGISDPVNHAADPRTAPHTDLQACETYSRPVSTIEPITEGIGYASVFSMPMIPRKPPYELISIRLRTSASAMSLSYGTR